MIKVEGIEAPCKSTLSLLCLCPSHSVSESGRSQEEHIKNLTDGDEDLGTGFPVLPQRAIYGLDGSRVPVLGLEVVHFPGGSFGLTSRAAGRVRRRRNKIARDNLRRRNSDRFGQNLSTASSLCQHDTGNFTVAGVHGPLHGLEPWRASANACLLSP